MLFAYPEATRAERPLLKKDLYQKAAPSSKERATLTEQVDKITWAHELSPNKVNINASDDLPTIQVFKLQLKPAINRIDESVLAYLDKNIPSALVFEVHSSTGIQTIACLKQVNANGSITCGPYLYGELMPHDAQRQALPTSRDFLHLHQQLLTTLLPGPLKAGESLTQAIERSLQINILDKAIEKLEKQLLNKNMQFNKRVELNSQLKSIKQTHRALLS